MKYKDLVSESHRTESLERHNDNLQDKMSLHSLHSSRKFRAVSMKIELQKNMLVDKNLSKGINKFLNPKGPQMSCIPHVR